MFEKIIREIISSSQSIEEKYNVKIIDHGKNGAIIDSTNTVRALFLVPNKYDGFEDDGWDETNSYILSSIDNVKRTPNSGIASSVLEAMKEFAKSKGRVVILHPQPGFKDQLLNLAQLKSWYARHGFKDVGDYWIWE